MFAYYISHSGVKGAGGTDAAFTGFVFGRDAGVRGAVFGMDLVFTGCNRVGTKGLALGLGTILGEYGLGSLRFGFMTSSIHSENVYVLPG